MPSNLLSVLSRYLTYSAAISDESVEATIFQYYIEDTLTMAKQISGIKSRALGKVDILAITDEDDDYCTKILKEASSKLFKHLHGYSKTIEGGYIFDEGPTILTYSALVTYSKDDFVRYTDELIYLVLNDGDTQPQWEQLTEAVNTKGTITYVMAKDDNYDMNSFEAADACFQKYLVDYVLSEWYSTLSLTDEQMRYKISAETNVSEGNSLMFGRIDPIRRPTGGL